MNDDLTNGAGAEAGTGDAFGRIAGACVMDRRARCRKPPSVGRGDDIERRGGSERPDAFGTPCCVRHRKRIACVFTRRTALVLVVAANDDAGFGNRAWALPDVGDDLCRPHACAIGTEASDQAPVVKRCRRLERCAARAEHDEPCRRRRGVQVRRDVDPLARRRRSGPELHARKIACSERDQRLATA